MLPICLNASGLNIMLIAGEIHLLLKVIMSAMQASNIHCSLRILPVACFMPCTRRCCMGRKVTKHRT